MQFNKRYTELMEDWTLKDIAVGAAKLAGKAALTAGTLATIGATPGQIKRGVQNVRGVFQEPRSKVKKTKYGRDVYDKATGSQQALGTRSRLLSKAFIHIGDRSRVSVQSNYADIDQRLNSTIREYIDELSSTPTKQSAFIEMFKDIYGISNITQSLEDPMKIFVKKYNKFVRDYRRRSGKDPVFNVNRVRSKRKKKTVTATQPTSTPTAQSIADAFDDI